MRFVHHKPIHTELFEGDYIVLLFLCFQPFKPCFQLFSGAFQLFNRKTFPVGVFDFRNTVCNFSNLITDDSLLPFPADGDTLRLTLPDDNRIIIAGCNARAETLSASLLKVAFGRHQNVCAGIQPQKLR